MTATNVHVIADNCFRLSMAHPTWEALGYKGRPGRGLVRIILTPSWKKALENKILRELLVIFAAAHLSATEANSELSEDVIDFFYGDDGRFERLYGPRTIFVKAVHEYLAAPLGNRWYAILIEHLGVLDLPDHNLRAQLLVHSTKFVEGVLTMMNYMRDNLDMSSWRPK